jgi:hypothetical protein
VTEEDATTRARRLVSLAEAALGQAEATRRAVEELLAEVGGARPAPVVPLDGALETTLDGALETTLDGALETALDGPLETALDGALETALDSARLVAIEMAVAGRSREEVGLHVRGAYDLADLEALLDDVFGPRVSSLQSAPRPGRAAP